MPGGCAHAQQPLSSAAGQTLKLPRPRALKRHLGRLQDVAIARVHSCLCGPGGAVLEFGVNVLHLQLVVVGRERGAHLLAILERAGVSKLVSCGPSVRVVVHLRGNPVFVSAQCRHHLHARRLSLDEPRWAQVHFVVSHVHRTRRGHLLQLGVGVVLRGESGALGGGRQLHLGVLGLEVVLDIIGQLEIVARPFHEVALQVHILEEVAVLVVIIVATQVGLEVTNIK
mmetsp:Transcript_27113/g.67172  ORF Transcript_27113/g.67172 Transcript_27113/m.67172 type:complete len:227 (+) Transcript_27113:188-868(+)